MCNCLDIPCKICGLKLPVHLGDFMTKPEEIECYCKGHLPKTDVRVFTLTENESRQYKKGWKMGIRSLTENAKNHIEINTPNLGVEFESVDR